MKREVIIYASILVLALVGAYLSWTQQTDERRETGVVLFDVDRDELKRVSYEKGNEFRLELSPRTDDYGEFIWVETERQTKDKAAVQDAFKAGSSIDSTIAALTPFVALRKIDDIEGRLAEFGLETPKANLTLESKAGARSFDVGAEGYGHRNVYVRDQDGIVYLVEGKAVRPLDTGDSRLPERRLIDAKKLEIEAATIRVKSQSGRFEQRNRDDRQKAFWVEAGHEEKNRPAEAWIDKILRMRSIGYAPADVNVSDFTVEFAVDFTRGDKTISVEVLHGTHGDKETWYGRSPLTRGLVELPLALAADASQDAATVLSDESKIAPEIPTKNAK